MRVLSGTIHIGRTSSNQEEDFISVRISDQDSGQTVVNLQVSFEDFARCLMSQQARCTFELNDPGKVGKRREVKTVFVASMGGLIELQDNGWEASELDIKKLLSDDVRSHRRAVTKDGRIGYNVTFVRYV
jgi:hypothetical protein